MSHGAAQRARVGIIARQSFLGGLIDEVLEEGRVVCLQLWGPLGRLELVVGCMPTGVRRHVHGQQGDDAPSLRGQRESLVRQLAARFSRSASLKLLAADWNFVCTKADRWNKDSGDFSSIYYVRPGPPASAKSARNGGRGPPESAAALVTVVHGSGRMVPNPMNL